MLQILSSLLVGLTLTISTAIAQTADPAAPTAISPPAATPNAGGGIEDWWWVIILIVLIAAAIWYLMRQRGTTGRV